MLNAGVDACLRNQNSFHQSIYKKHSVSIYDLHTLTLREKIKSMAPMYEFPAEMLYEFCSHQPVPPYSYADKLSSLYQFTLTNTDIDQVLVSLPDEMQSLLDLPYEFAWQSVCKNAAYEMKAETPCTASPPVAKSILRTGVVQEDANVTPSRPHDIRAFGLPDRPLNVIHVGPFFLKGGAEQWLLDFVANVDPQILRVTRCISTFHEMMDLNYVADLSSRGVILECGGSESVQEAAREADVLISWGMELDGLMGDVRAPLSIQVVHGDGPLNRTFLERSAVSVDHAVAVSHRVRDRVCDVVPTTTIYNAVDAARIAPSRAREETRRLLGFSEDDFVVGFSGRFAHEKRPHAIVDAVAQLPPKYKVLLVGWGRLLPTLREQCEQLLPGRHVITCADGDIGDLYRAMDATCLVSDQEGFPLAIIEAMLCGRPIVSTPVGCIPEFITDRVNGLITDGTPEHLAETLQKMGDNQYWANAVAEQGFRLAERFGYARRMARDYEYLIQHLWQSKCY